MTLTRLALNSLYRRRAKALMLSTGIAIGVGTVMTLYILSTAIRAEVGDQLDRYGANIIVLPQSRTLALDYGGLALPGVTFDQHALSEEDATRIAQIPYRERLSTISPKIIGTTEIEGHAVVLAGVRFSQELKLRRWWKVHGAPPGDSATREVLVGFEAAQALGVLSKQPQMVVIGHNPDSHGSVQESTIKPQRDALKVKDGVWRVAAVIGRTGGPEDHMIFAPLAAVQDVLGRKGRLDLIEISALCKDCPVEDIVAQIQARVPHAKVAAVQQAVRMREEMVQRLTRFSWVVSVVVVLIGSLLVMTTMMTSVVERTREIGVLRAMGFRRMHIIQVLATEVMTISAVGGLAGWMGGLAASWIALPFFAENISRPAVEPVIALLAVASAIILAITASIQPLFKASRLDPTEALRAL